MMNVISVLHSKRGVLHFQYSRGCDLKNYMFFLLVCLKLPSSLQMVLSIYSLGTIKTLHAIGGSLVFTHTLVIWVFQFLRFYMAFDGR